MLNKCLKRGRPEAEKIMIKKTIKIPLFWKIYIIVVTIVLIGFVVLWSILWTALKKYEQSRPEYAMDKITEQIQLQDTGDFTCRYSRCRSKAAVLYHASGAEQWTDVVSAHGQYKGSDSTGNDKRRSQPSDSRHSFH